MTATLNRDATAVSESVLGGGEKCVDVVSEGLERIRRLNPLLNAYVYVDWEGALGEAERVDRLVSEGRRLPLAGVTVAVKDVISVRGLPLTAGSRVLRGYTSPYDATVVSRLRGAGCVVLGMTNTDEFAMGSSTENSSYGPSRNPWSEGRVPGGSSGGSAVALASGTSLLALGSDTGGSVRLPAAFNGVYGLKPTYGSVSRYGLIAFSNSIEQIGFFSRSVRDVEAVYSVCSGRDGMDGTTYPYPSEALPGLAGGGRLRVGVVKQGSSEGVYTGVRERFDYVVRRLGESGASVGEVDLPYFEYCLAAYYLIAMSEASTNLARYDGVRYGVHPGFGDDWSEEFSKVRALFGREVKRRILMGAFALSAGFYDMYYESAARFRTLIVEGFRKLFQEYDVLVLPTSATPAFKLGEKTAEPLSMYLSDVFTVPANLSGIPALSVPVGTCVYGGEELPVGVQLMSRWGYERLLFKVAGMLESAGVARCGVVEPWGKRV